MPDQSLHAITRHFWGPVVAVTAVHAGVAGGQIAVSAIGASILPERPRLLISLWKANRTHDLVLAAGACAVHLLQPDQLDLVTALGHRSGHDLPDKLAGMPWRPGLTGSPLLTDCPVYVEGTIAGTLDGGDMTVILLDLVAGSEAGPDAVMTLDRLNQQADAAWHARESARRAAARAAARKYFAGH